MTSPASKRSATHGPFSGWTVRLIDSEYWSDMSTAKVLRRLGARVVYRDTDTTTHIITTHRAPDINSTKKTWMPFHVFNDYVSAVNRVVGAGNTVERWSHDQLNDAIDAAQAEKRNAAHLRREAVFLPLQDAATKASVFVGF